MTATKVASAFGGNPMAFANLFASVHWERRHHLERVEPQEMPGEDTYEHWERDVVLGPPAVRICARSLWTTPEDIGAAGLIFLVNPGLCIVADARLDNRRELAVSLGVDEADRTDTSLILSAYMRWGVESSRHLTGDFAFVLWDESRRLLFAARDALGVRALHYSATTERVFIGSTVGSVRRHPATANDLNRPYLTRFVNGRTGRIPDQTAWSSVLRLQPGHVLTATERTTTTSWSDRITPLPVSTRFGDQDIWAQFRALMDQAVVRRLRSSHSTGLLLSGGFDSSSIALLANLAVAEGRIDARVKSFSATFNDGSRGDERAYLNAVLETAPHIEAQQYIWQHEWSLDRLGPGDGILLDEPAQSSRFFGVLLTRFAAEAGCRAVLTGLWGDQLVLRQPYFHGGLLWDLPAARLFRELPYFVRTAGVARLAIGSLRTGSRALTAWLRGHGPQSAVSALLDERFIWGNNGVGMVSNDRIARAIGVENRFPFLDRDLQAFVRGLPTGAFFQLGERKRFLRRAMGDVLPASFQHRTSFAAITHAYLSGINRERPRMLAMLESPRVLDLGIASETTIKRVTDSLRDEVKPQGISEIQRLLSAELWIRHVLQ